MSSKTELLKGNAATLVLNLLSRKDMYGYEIIQELHLRSEGFFELREGTLYPILHLLERDGNVESYWQEPASGRQRKYYQITKQGRLLLKEKKSEWVEFRKAVASILGAELKSEL